jgi:pimeloyl-ACP methyl ester carboxylesterase
MSGQAPLFAEWEKDFTVVQWDQPGGGATYAKNKEIDIGPLTPERFVNDGLAVAELVRSELHVHKIVLMGISWGSELGLMMVKQRPQLFSAFVGTAQVVGRRGAKLGYELGLKAAKERNDTKAIEALERVGPPPYKTFEDYLVRQQFANPPGLPASPAENAANVEAAKLLSAPTPPDAHYVAKGLPEVDFIQAFLSTQKAFYQQQWGFEARDLGPDYAVPVFVFQGENDINAPTVLAKEFVDEIRAPEKKFAVIPGAGHMTIAFHAELLKLLDTYVRPIAVRSS